MKDAGFLWFHTQRLLQTRQIPVSSMELGAFDAFWAEDLMIEQLHSRDAGGKRSSRLCPTDFGGFAPADRWQILNITKKWIREYLELLFHKCHKVSGQSASTLLLIPGYSPPGARQEASSQ